MGERCDDDCAALLPLDSAKSVGGGEVALLRLSMRLKSSYN